MLYRLLLVDGQGNAASVPLGIRMLREFPGPERLSVHFRPVRNDVLFESARGAGQLAYRILRGEGIVRAQLTVEYAVPEALQSVMGRSSDLLFALALVTGKWKRPATIETAKDTVIAATGILGPDGTVRSVEHTAAKVAAAVAELTAAPATATADRGGARAVIFYPAADAAAVHEWRASTPVPAHIDLVPVEHLDDALAHLGYTLDRVYLRNPFRGLEHFDYADHAIFFGRDAEVREVVELLLRRERAGAPGLLVEGASGSGKSSFLRAGVLPALVEPRFQPEAVQEALRQRPVSAAAGRAIWRPGLLGAGAAAEEAQFARSIAEVWGESPCDTLAELAASLRERWPAAMRFVWLIDQFEELLVRGLPDAMIDAFGRFLLGLQAAGVWTLASIRADAMPLLKRHEALREVFGANEGQYYLATLGGTALDAVITLPAQAADLAFEIGEDGKPLDQLLREDAYREKDSLPMLQFTLNELYQKRVGSTLTLAAYRELGGLSGSIATTAAGILSEGEDSQRAAQRVFRSLVSVDDSGHATRRYAPMAESSGDAAQARLVQRFIEARLCVTDQRNDQAVVAFAHDTLLKTLPALTGWLQRETGLMQTRELAQRETRAWQQHGEADDWLAAADKLADFETLEAAQVVLPDPVRSFIDRSRRRVRRLRRIRRTAIGAIAVLAVGVVVGAVAFGLQARKAEIAGQMTARRGEFLEGLLKSADPRGGSKDVTVAHLLDAAMRQIDPLATQEPLVAASMLELIAETDNGLGRYAEGLAASTRAVDLLRANGAGAVELSAALSTRGRLLLQLSKAEEAEPVLREALALALHQRGAEKQVTEALDALGQAVENEGRKAEAEALYKQQIDMHRRLGHPFGAAEAWPFDHLSDLAHDQGRDADSLTYLRQAVDIDKKYLPPDHPDLLAMEYDYAAALEYNHQAAAAEPIFRQLLDSYRRIDGPEHRDTLMVQQGLAHNLLSQHRFAEAAAEALPAAEGLAKVAGDTHSWTMVAWAVYGRAACRNGEGEKGLEALQRVLEVRKQIANDWRVASSNVTIGDCLVAMHRYGEAEPVLLGAVAELTKSKGKWTTTIDLASEALHELYAATGRMAEAEKWQSKPEMAELKSEGNTAVTSNP
jgi:tetratricopeptide (TPR) repeat protein